MKQKICHMQGHIRMFLGIPLTALVAMPVAALSDSHRGVVSDWRLSAHKLSPWSPASGPAPAPGFAKSPAADSSDQFLNKVLDSQVALTGGSGAPTTPIPLKSVGSLPADVALKLDAVLATGQAQDAARTAEAASSLRAELAGKEAKKAKQAAKAAAYQSVHAMDAAIVAQKVVDDLAGEIDVGVH
mmetsp:Transcript_104766/g.208169  ORF Transcript_104766/g.208169 Transcript_104766/m.208169 type:complete len:186 (+) Transcript_104766:63-620(+)